MTKSESPEHWSSVLEQLIVGVSHQLSNRISTLAGVSDILAGDPSVPPILQALSDEVPRLEETIRLLRLLAAPNEPDEAIEVPRLVNDALALAHVHPRLKEVEYLVDNGADVPPVVGKPVALTHQVLTAMAQAANGAGAPVTIQFVVDGDDVIVRAGTYDVRAKTLMASRLL